MATDGTMYGRPAVDAEVAEALRRAEIEYNANLRGLRERVADLEAALGRATTELMEMRTDNRALTKACDRLTEERDRLQQEVDRLTDDLTSPARSRRATDRP